MISKIRAKEIALNWHGGQWSALYQFASSGIYMYENHLRYLKEIEDSLHPEYNLRPSVLSQKNTKELNSLRKWFIYKGKECGAGWIFKKDRLQEVSDALQAAQEAQENKEPEAAQTTPELPETAIIPTPPHVQIVQDMNHIMSHFDPRHPVNICDPKSSQYREVIKELNEQPKHYDNLQDITEAAESGQVISLFNLSQLV